jgi:hypothetical protein
MILKAYGHDRLHIAIFGLCKDDRVRGVREESLFHVCFFCSPRSNVAVGIALNLLRVGVC